MNEPLWEVRWQVDGKDYGIFIPASGAKDAIERTRERHRRQGNHEHHEMFAIYWGHLLGPHTPWEKVHERAEASP